MELDLKIRNSGNDLYQSLTSHTYTQIPYFL